MKLLITSSSAIICEGLELLLNNLRDSSNEEINIFKSSRSNLSNTDFNINWIDEVSIDSSGVSDIYFDAVINTVGVPYKMESISKEPYSFLINSNLILKNILSKLKYDKFIHISSPSIYSVNWLKKNINTLTETHKLGEIKIYDDIFVKNFCDQNNKKIILLRPKSILSLREFPREKDGHIFSELTYKLLNKKINNLSIECSSSQKLKFLAPEDLWIEISKLIINKSENIVKNIEGDNQISIYEFIKEIIKFGFDNKLISNNIVIKFKDKKHFFNSLSFKLLESKNYQIELIRKYLNHHYG